MNKKRRKIEAPSITGYWDNSQGEGEYYDGLGCHNQLPSIISSVTAIIKIGISLL